MLSRCFHQAAGAKCVQRTHTIPPASLDPKDKLSISSWASHIVDVVLSPISSPSISLWSSLKAIEYIGPQTLGKLSHVTLVLRSSSPLPPIELIFQGLPRPVVLQVELVLSATCPVVVRSGLSRPQWQRSQNRISACHLLPMFLQLFAFV